jgi:hypothetical protein
LHPTPGISTGLIVSVKLFPSSSIMTSTAKKNEHFSRHRRIRPKRAQSDFPIPDRLTQMFVAPTGGTERQKKEKRKKNVPPTSFCFWG